MSEKVITVAAGIIFLLVLWFGVRLLSGEDDWICSNGQWIKHGVPSAPMPNEPCLK